MAYLDLAAAEEAIRRFNGYSPLPAADRLVARHFPSPQAALEPATIAERVVLIDGVWTTQMFWKAGTMPRVIARLEEHAEGMLPVLEGLAEDALERRPEQIVEAANRLMPVILDAWEGAGGPRPYSFASKFLHRSIWRQIPIVDGRARSAVRRFQVEHALRPPVTPEGGDLAEYPRWIGFYSALIRSLSVRDRERLRAADEAFQPGAGRQPSSLLRLLDKVFYVMGSGSRLPAAGAPLVATGEHDLP